MYFETGHLYHIYNQGNNLRNIFFISENYRFFLKKIKTHILPFADVLAWCLMPNHFHLMVHVNEVEVDERLVSQSGRDLAMASPGATSSRTRTLVKMSLNKSIGIMLASYTRAINKQRGWSGSLFRKETKAICLSQPEGITPAWFMDSGITRLSNLSSEKEYPNMCFNYIQYNPVNAGLVKKAEDWEFSSYRGNSGIQDDSLIDINRIKEYGLEVSAIDKSGSNSKFRP